MVDRDVVLRKSEAIEHHGSRLRAKLPFEPARLQADESLRNDVCFDALQAIQACIDLAVHACSHDSLGVPDGPARAFALLGEHGIIPADLAARLSRAAGLRNLIVHRYTDLDMAKLASVIEAGLGDLDAFAARLRLRAGLPVYADDT
ncbi:MAG: type VII toxin-antitoxin system HepT family RNase toxin [Betaproteobacteria bacterium]